MKTTNLPSIDEATDVFRVFYERLLSDPSENNNICGPLEVSKGQRSVLLLICLDAHVGHGMELRSALQKAHKTFKK